VIAVTVKLDISEYVASVAESIYIKSFYVFVTTSTAPFKVLFIVTFSCIAWDRSNLNLSFAKVNITGLCTCTFCLV